MRFLIFAACVLALQGCAQYQWQKPGATQADFNRDAYQCHAQAAQLYPAVMVSQQLTSGYVAPATTNCSTTATANRAFGTVYGTGNTTCTTTPGAQIQPVVYTTDANSDNRTRAANGCMIARGYQMVQVR